MDIKEMCKKPGKMNWVFLVIAVLLVGIALCLFQFKAFPESGSSPFAKVSVTVYTSLPDSSVLLGTSIEPNELQGDSISVTVKGPKGVSDPWLLVITCPHPEPGQVEMELQGGNPVPPVWVYARIYQRSRVPYIPLGCSAPRTRSASARTVVVQGESISLTLPVLEQNPLAQLTNTNTPMYVVRSQTGRHPIERLVEYVQAPKSSCPTPSAHPSAVATPETTQSTAPGASAPCFAQPLNQITSEYDLPAPSSVTTTETLENLSLSGDSIQSNFPPGQITSHDQVIWQGGMGLSPSLSATSLTDAKNASKATFWAGLLYGMAAGFLVPFLQVFARK